MTKQVSIIIVNYNTSRLLLDSVDSVVRQVKGVDYEIIVADNHSSEEQRRMLRNDGRFSLLELPENVGFGQANNAAAKVAQGEYLLLLNPDTVLLNDAVTLLYDYMRTHHAVGICGGNLFDGELQLTHSFHRLFPSFLSELDFAMGQLYRRLRYGKNAQYNTTGHALSVAMITGADLMISREVWEQLQGFSPKFFMYYEDADLCLRCKQLGQDVVSVPQAHVQHLEGQSFVESESHVRRILTGRFQYFRMHYSRGYNWLTDRMNIVTLRAAVLAYGMMGKKERATNYRLRLTIYQELLQ